MRSLRLMIADDHESFRAGLRALLKDQPGWQIVAEASNGREAVAKAAKTHPDVALLDFGMPVLNGLEAARQIVRRAPQTKIVMLTVHDDSQGFGVRGAGEVGALLGISVKTAETHRSNLMHRLNCRSVVDLGALRRAQLDH